RTGVMARGGGGEVAPIRSRGGRQMEIDATWLDDRTKVLGIDLQDPRHPGERDHDAPLDRDRASGESGARPARDDRHGVLVTETRQSADVGRGLGERDCIGGRRVDGAVVLIDQELIVRAENLGRPEKVVQRANERRAAHPRADCCWFRYDAAPAWSRRASARSAAVRRRAGASSAQRCRESRLAGAEIESAAIGAPTALPRAGTTATATQRTPSSY